MRRNRHNSAFTLIEVIVASLIVSLLAAGLAASLHIAFKARRAAVEGTASARAMRIVMEGVARDLVAALPPTGTFAGAFTATESTGSGFDADSVTFFNTADPTRPLDGASDIEEVTLTVIAESELQLPTNDRVAKNNASSLGLTRTSSSSSSSQSQYAENVQGPLLETSRLPRSTTEGLLVRRVRRRLLAQIDDTPTDQVISRNVRSFKLRYYDGTDWQTTWDSTAVNNVLPLAVEVTVVLGIHDTGEAGATKVLTRVVRLPCGEAVTDSTETTSSTGTP